MMSRWCLKVGVPPPFDCRPELSHRGSGAVYDRRYYDAGGTSLFMGRCYIRVVPLRHWFPPDDQLAEEVARLCVLREDLALEMSGFYSENLGELDGNSDAWRRAYFFRNLVRTIREIAIGFNRLAMNPEFKDILARAPLARQNEFKKAMSEMNSAHPVIKQIRDSVGGHVLNAEMRKALAGMHFERFGFIEVGESNGKTHYQFAGELVGEILMAGVPEEQRMVKLQDDLEKISALLSLFSLIDWILYTYIRSRRLIP